RAATAYPRAVVRATTCVGQPQLRANPQCRYEPVSCDQLLRNLHGCDVLQPAPHGSQNGSDNRWLAAITRSRPRRCPSPKHVLSDAMGSLLRLLDDPRGCLPLPRPALRPPSPTTDTLADDDQTSSTVLMHP